MTTLKPMVGQWYLCRHRGQMFEVVSIDDSDGTVELQDYDGNLDELDIKAWFEQDVETIDPPEDLAGALDVAEPDEADGGDPVEPNLDAESSSLEAVEDVLDETLDDESDEWAKGGSRAPDNDDELGAPRRY